jgi:hypothetical protein
VTLTEFARLLRDAPDELRTNLHRSLTALAIQGEASAKRNATTRPKVRSGRLRNSIVGEVRDGTDGPTLTLRAGEGLVYARVQEGPEDGSPYTLIRARAGGYLAIPVGSSLTGAGVYRGTGGPVRLVREVRIPATRFLGRAFEQTLTDAAQTIQTAAGEALS